MSPDTRRSFIKTVRTMASRHARSFPWRETTDPYYILVSEVMLQQTQVSRVVFKYTEFIARFPTIVSFAESSLGDVLRVWSGLGYNRRAKMLHSCAQAIVREWGGVVPENYDELKRLPGIGPYTAGAVMAFAYNTPYVMIETNIRSVYIHHFFSDKNGVSDREILPLIEETLDEKSPREWYAMLMDYGAYLKQTQENPSKQSAHYTKQTPFKGSVRERRGAVIRTLADKSQTAQQLMRTLPYSQEEIGEVLSVLSREGMVRCRGRVWALAT